MNTPFFPLTELTAISPLDGRYRKKLEVLSDYCSERAFIKMRIEVEAKYLIALSKAGIIRKLSNKEQRFLLTLGENVTTSQIKRVKEIEKTTNHDIKSVELALREFLSKTSLKDIIHIIHFALTSEDVSNIAQRALLQDAVTDVIVPAVEQIIKMLSKDSKKYASLPFLARTHGQPAVPTTLGKELKNFSARLIIQKTKLEKCQLTGKVNGAVGNFNAHVFAVPKLNWISFSKTFIKQFNLKPNLFTTQINPYDDVIELFQIIQRINGIILDLNQDMWRYISDDIFVQEMVKGEVGSSTMPQKINPILFENSEGNVVIANSLIEAMTTKLAVSRLQRDLSDKTVSRNFGVILGHTLLAYQNTAAGLKRVYPNTELIKENLNQNWTILSEAVQTLLRLEGEENAYTSISMLSKGKVIQEEDWLNWVNELKISPEVRNKLKKLRPEQYLGYAKKLASL
jgi:adenylosuccinate lyase